MKRFAIIIFVVSIFIGVAGWLYWRQASHAAAAVTLVDDYPHLIQQMRVGIGMMIGSSIGFVMSQWLLVWDWYRKKRLTVEGA